MGKRLDVCAIITAIVNLTLFLFNGLVIGYHIHLYWKTNATYATILLLHVVISHTLLTSIFAAVPMIIMREELNEMPPEEITMRRWTSRIPPPFWNNHWEPSKEA